MVTYKKVKIKHKEIRYLDIGKGKEIFFLHGLAIPIKEYIPLIKSLSKHYRVIAPEIPLKSTLRKYYGFIKSFSKKINQNPQIIIAHSLGTVIAQSYTKSEPKIKREIDINPPLNLHHSFARNIKRMLIFRKKTKLGNFNFILHGTKNLKSYQSLYNHVKKAKYNKGQFSCKTLLIQGEEDKIFKADKDIEEKIKSNKNVSLIKIPKATHALPISHPRKTSKIIKDFLKIRV